MDEVRIIVVSSVRPEPTSAGQIILHRHLIDQSGISLQVFGSEPRRRTLSWLVRRIGLRLGNTRLHRLVNDFWVLFGGRWHDPELPSVIENAERTIVLTVAHGDGFMAALRFAKRHRLPLVSLFQDWWPEIAPIHGPFRQLLEREFRKLYRSSDLSICVCAGMKQALGENENTIVLHPLPAEVSLSELASYKEPNPFRVVYFGNLVDYGPMLGDLLEESMRVSELHLEVRGANPAWSEIRKEKLRTCGRWLDFAPRAELDNWLASASAFLVPMVFRSDLRRRMETSFPSKLIEFAQFGRPLIVWGPEYCSAIQWARSGDKAICITDPRPAAVVSALRELKNNPAMQDSFAVKAREAAAGEFNPTRIQARFREALNDVLANHGGA